MAAEQFPQHREIVTADDEEYAIYNLFFELRDDLNDAVSHGDKAATSRILDFAGRCLRNELTSNGEDISVAAGVSLFEHIFEDCSPKDWRRIFSSMPRNTYEECRSYVEKWMDADAFSEVEREAKIHYAR